LKISRHKDIFITVFRVFLFVQHCRIGLLFAVQIIEVFVEIVDYRVCSSHGFLLEMIVPRAGIAVNR
jgi:hypothetical protein